MPNEKNNNQLYDEIIKLHGKTDTMQVELIALGKETAKLVTLLQGDKDPSTGLIVRIDRIEQDKKKVGWIAKTAGAAAVGAVVISLLSWASHGTIQAAPEQATHAVEQHK